MKRLVLLILLVILLLSVSANGEGDSNSYQIMLPQFSSEHNNNYAVYEGEDLTACVKVGPIPTEVIATVKGTTLHDTPFSAIGGVDYKPKEFSLTFTKSTSNQTECSQISIIQDGLDEHTEGFELQLLIEDGKITRNRKNISISACRIGDIVLRESPSEQFSIVDYCSKSNNNHYWITICDEAGMWTDDDATVACRQANKAGNSVGYYILEERINNTLGMLFECQGNESKLNECIKTRLENHEPIDCYPVLVECNSESTSSSGGVNIAAAISVPVVLLVVGGGVCIAVIAAIFLSRRRKLQQKQAGSYTQAHDGKRVSNSENQHSNSAEDCNNRRRHRQAGIGATPNRNSPEDVEYSSPFTQTDRKSAVIPPALAKLGKVARQHVGVKQPGLAEEQHYEGCDMAKLRAGAAARTVADVSFGIMAQYSELEKSSYSHTEHK